MPVKTTSYRSPLVYGETFKGPYPYGQDSVSTSSIVTFSRWRSYSNTPEFSAHVRSKRKSKLISPASLPMTSYYDSRQSTKLGNHSLYFLEKATGKKGLEFGCFGIPSSTIPPINQDDPLFASLRNLVISKIPSKMNGNSFNLPLFLLEARKTVTMVRDMVETVKNHFSSLSPSQIHNYWLEYRYGWRLLAKDIYDSLVAIHDVRTRGIKQHVRAKEFQSRSSSYVELRQTAGVLGGYYTPAFDQHHEVTDLLECSIVLNYIDNPVIGTLQTFGITNPLSLAWELVPYSFVLDWFIPIGNYLQTLDGYLGKLFKSGTISYMRQYTDTITPRNPQWGYPYSSWFSVQALSTGPSTRIQRIYRRDVLVDFPYATLPSIDINLGLPRLLDALSLATQQIGGKLNAAQRLRL